METRTVNIANIMCGHCIRTIQRELMAMPGVSRVSGDTDMKQVAIDWDAPATWQDIAGKLEEIGYPAKA